MLFHSVNVLLVMLMAMLVGIQAGMHCPIKGTV